MERVSAEWVHRPRLARPVQDQMNVSRPVAIIPASSQTSAPTATTASHPTPAATKPRRTPRMSRTVGHPSVKGRRGQPSKVTAVARYRQLDATAAAALVQAAGQLCRISAPVVRGVTQPAAVATMASTDATNCGTTSSSGCSRPNLRPPKPAHSANC